MGLAKWPELDYKYKEGGSYMRSLVSFSACLLLFSCALLAQDSSKPNFTGAWQLDPARSELNTNRVSGANWVIEEKDNSIHITETEAGKGDRKIELKCTTDGKECNVPSEKAKASFWYNGPMLVEMETKGDNATRYRLKLVDDGKVLNVEVTYIVPQIEKPDKLVFSKQP